MRGRPYNLRGICTQVSALIGAIVFHVALIAAFIVPNSESLKGALSKNLDVREGGGVSSTQSVVINLVPSFDAVTVADRTPEVAALKTTDIASISRVAATARRTEVSKPLQPLINVSDLVDPVVDQGSVQAPPLSTLASGGEIDGTKDILAQIARCLPKGSAPSLPFASLNLTIDAQGNLAAVPRMNLDLDRASPEDIAAANQIIQASLQCGPYKLPGSGVTTYSLTPDFKDVVAAS